MNRNTRPFRVIIGVITMLTCLASAASAQTTWTEFDHSKLFLNDLSAGPATYVAAFLAGENGEITGNMANMRLVKVSPVGTKIATVKANDFVATETLVDRGILMNDSNQTIVAYFQTANELVELWIFPQEGVLIGQLPKHGGQMFDKGCRCICDIGGGEYQKAIITCESILEELPAGSNCVCGAINGDDCMAYNDSGDLIEGNLTACKRIWYPRPESTDNGTGDSGEGDSGENSNP
ncbi:MAG: hypothetical protein ACF8MJ_05845 [Phycisphaerales bacterium JB050]